MLDVAPAPLPQNGAEPPPFQFLAHVHCGQTAGWIKIVVGMNMALGKEVGLSPGNFVLDGDPAHSPKRGRSPPNFGPFIAA